MSPKKTHKKNHRKDKSSGTHDEDKQDKKKKRRKDKSSDQVEDKKIKKQNIDNKQQLEFVYYNPSIIQEVDVFQAPAQDSHVSQEVEDVEAVGHDVEAIEQDEMKE
ncbi:hypothetical protein J2Y03_004270 [Neobacillus niacini]|uniref:hypothetical protein n=1 Tax=Neobacillus niacini TaxID=86668 RepID=UPI00285E0681|nr:hypothetical protein [Neobacillus niacini]MDR7079212.1 hypothetical protein [Neobacillus niacini]